MWIVAIEDDKIFGLGLTANQALADAKSRSPHDQPAAHFVTADGRFAAIYICDHDLYWLLEAQPRGGALSASWWVDAMGIAAVKYPQEPRLTLGKDRTSQWIATERGRPVSGFGATPGEALADAKRRYPHHSWDWPVLCVCGDALYGRLERRASSSIFTVQWQLDDGGVAVPDETSWEQSYEGHPGDARQPVKASRHSTERPSIDDYTWVAISGQRILGFGPTPDQTLADAERRHRSAAHDGPFPAICPCDDELYRMLGARPADDALLSVPWCLDSEDCVVVIDEVTPQDSSG